MQQNLVSSNGHLKISASASQHQHRLWNWHCKNFVFAFRSLFEKIEHFCSFLYSIMISVPLYVSTIPAHPSKGVHWCFRKRLFDFSEASVHRCFEKITAPKILVYFQAKHIGWSLFQSTLAGLPGIFSKSCFEQLFCIEPFRACFREKKIHNRRNCSNFPVF